MTPSASLLAGKTALVTGGSRSLGRDIALRLADYGADVIVTYKRNADGAKTTANDIRSRGRRDAPGLDVLVQSAGISSHGPLGQITEAQVDDVYEVNYESVLFLTQALLCSDDAHWITGQRIEVSGGMNL